MSKIDYSYETILRNWDVKKEQQKADFMERMYQCYQPANHCIQDCGNASVWKKLGPTVVMSISIALKQLNS